ncbi:MAG: ABC transporter permease subunit [Bdellovibrionia bacterium]
MSGILTIAKRDFKSYFAGPGFYFVAALFLGFSSYTYSLVLQKFAHDSFQYMMQTQGKGGGLNLHTQVIVAHISNLNLFLLFTSPFLTMKLLSEEKKMRSFDLLLTSPVTSTDIIVGKFLAGFGVALSLILVSLVYPIATMLFTEVQWGPLASAYVGLALLAAAYIAIGVFASSLTDSLIFAGCASFIFCLLLWFIAWSSVAVEDPTLQMVLQHFSVSQHFGQFVRGSIELKSFVFHFSVVFMYCFLAQRVVESHRWR